MMSENKPTQQCTICGSLQPLSADTCAICGATLPGEPTTTVTPVNMPTAPVGMRRPYDSANGDDDLYAGDLMRRVWRVAVVGIVIVTLAIGIGIGVLVTRVLGDDEGSPAVVATNPTPTGTNRAGVEGGATAPPTATPRGGFVATETPGVTARPTMAMATITPAPPTETPSPTPGPCMVTARSGDTVLGLAYQCGHQDMAVVDLILEINGMGSATELREGQTLEIPWPSPTPGGEATQPPEDGSTGDMEASQSDSAGGAEEVTYNEFGTPDSAAQYADVEPTLRPGQAWHTVSTGETILSIAYQYETSIETLSQINPEVPFLQCDYSSPTGGENCSVMLYEGQRIRVPVPLPTETPPPTPAGTLTPTPQPSPTVNMPYLISPEDGTHFFADEQVTLRWGGTGVLGENDRYVVHVRDLETGQNYMALVRETSYVLPGGWQPDDLRKHRFEWAIGVGTVNSQNELLEERSLTDLLEFSWDSR